MTGVAPLARALRRRETSAGELAERALERLDTTGRELGAVVTLTAERAREEAARADRELRAGVDRGPLHGIPYGAKDLFAAAGYPTTWGAAPFREQRFAADAAAVERLGRAGAVLVAKLSTIELAGGLGYNQPDATFTGPARSPWGRRDAWAGGSSSGPAAAVGAGCVPFALGTETLGSIVQPSAFSGVTGFRPTYGAVPMDGVMALTWTMDRAGPMATCARDCATVMRAVAARPPAARPRLARPLRLAVLAAAAAAASPDVRRSFERSLEACRDLGTLTELDLGDWPWAEVASIVVRAEVGATFGRFIAAGGADGLSAPEARVNALDTLAVSAEAYIGAQRLRERMCRDLDARLAPFDALLAPAMPFVATPVDEPFTAYYELDYDLSLIMAGNLAGLPALAMPNGLGEGGLPTSLTVVGRAGEDARVLATGAAIERLLPDRPALPAGPRR